MEKNDSFKSAVDALYSNFLEIYFQGDLSINSKEKINHEKIEALFYTILTSFMTKERLSSENMDHLVQLHIDTETPFIVFINKLNFLENGLLHILLDNGQYDEIKRLDEACSLFKHNASQAYLHSYLNSLRSLNKIRLIRLSEIIEKNLLRYYEQHIIWLNKITDALLQGDTAHLPELDTKECAFGKWLHSQGKHAISNNSKFTAINKLHNTLHAYLHQIAILIPYNSDKFHLTLTFLEKMEMISLEIGTELALIDSTMLIAKAAKDPLTGVLNRSLLDQLFFNQFEIAQATERPFILAMCDLDYFKDINDTYGHLAGDALLKLFADVVKNVLRSSDIIIRYGGEEFIIILPALSAEQGLNVLDNVRLKFQNSVLIYNDLSIKATVSIGMTVIPSDETNMNMKECINKYIDRADSQLYKAKTEGRNRVK